MNCNVALTIAGSDSGGCAGIQADLKTFAAHGVHGASVLTCVTAQNTTGVSRVDALEGGSVVAQLSAVCSDMNVAAAKTGMLLNSSIVAAVVGYLETHPISNLVVDPVMISRSGDKLLDDDAVDAIRSNLLPLALVLTPNCHEAALLSGVDIVTLEDMKLAAKKIFELGPTSVLVKGGGLKGEHCGTDVWFDGKRMEVLTTQFVETTNTNGTGCSLSAAITANLTSGHDALQSCVAAKEYITRGLRKSLSIGKGRGPICHFHASLED